MAFVTYSVLNEATESERIAETRLVAGRSVQVVGQAHLQE